MSRGALVRRVAGYAIVIAAAGFLYATISRNWRELADFPWTADPLLLPASLLVHVAVLAWGVYIWSLVLRMLGAPPVAYGRLLRIWSASNLTKYIPGSVWQFFTAAHLSRSEGMTAVITMTAMILHTTFSLLAALVIAALALPLEASPGGLASPWVRGVGVALILVLVHPSIVNAVLRLVPRALHREVLLWDGRWVDGVRLLALSLLSWAAYGVAFSLFVGALTPISLSAVVPLTAVNALSFAAGYVALVAPGGIGVREAAMTMLLAPLLPAAVAAVLAIGARLWSITAELILAAAGVLFARRPDGASTVPRPTRYLG